MAIMYHFWAFIFSLIFALVFAKANYGDQKVYIAYMGHLPKGDHSVSDVHTNMLQAAVGSRASKALIHSYKRSFNGFAAKLTENEKNIIARMDGVVTMFPSEKIQLHTTRSWDFIGFPQNVNRSTTESDVIVGMLDTGLWPESKSFDDTGYGPPPAKFKGSCQSVNFTCNNKVIGARFYRADGNFTNGDIASPRDTGGHGSHTASVAAGRQVNDVSLYDLAKGNARGGVPSARIAVYKMCWYDGCFTADVLAAFDDAIADGVDIISLSMGWNINPNYFDDPIAIGSFHAMKNGILTSSSAGNFGPTLGTTANVAPWLLTVAASLTDRSFITNVQLGNNQTLPGISVNAFQLDNKMYPLVYGGNVTNTAGNFTQEQAGICALDSLDQAQIKGKIVLCNIASQDIATSAAAAAGVVMFGSQSKDTAYPFSIPASFLGLTQGAIISNYVNTTSDPTCTIQKSTEGVWNSAPFVASFSSRGPNSLTMDLLKPDISAPGVDILAAWSDTASSSELFGDTRLNIPYNIMSGTSMACPHATGAAAYLKSLNPSWSPAAIKSALMTTAKPMSRYLNSEAEFAYGSGQINPVKALNPGLVYDLEEADYVSFLCGQGISSTNVQLITGDNSTTCSESNMATVWDLNYPSFAISGAISDNVTRVFHRTVTNIGSPVSTYKANVSSTNPLLNIVVVPDVLSFKSLGQKLSFVVTVNAKPELIAMSGSLVWDDGMHQVRSPIVAHGYT